MDSPRDDLEVHRRAGIVEVVKQDPLLRWRERIDIFDVFEFHLKASLFRGAVESATKIWCSSSLMDSAVKVIVGETKVSEGCGHGIGSGSGLRLEQLVETEELRGSLRPGLNRRRAR
jgi:hypothetical protein